MAPLTLQLVLDCVPEHRAYLALHHNRGYQDGEFSLQFTADRQVQAYFIFQDKEMYYDVCKSTFLSSRVARLL